VTRFFKRTEATIIIGCVLLVVIFTLVDSQGWYSFFTIRNITSYTAVLGLMAIGETLVILVREIDLSVGSTYGLVAITFISLEPAVGVYVSFVIALIIGAVIGLLNALLVLKGTLSSMIVTLGGLFFYRGVIYVTTSGAVRSLSNEDAGQWFVKLFGGRWFLGNVNGAWWLVPPSPDSGLANGVWWFLIAVIIFTFILFRMRYGNHLLAVGGNPISAASRGVPVQTVKTIAFIMCSSLCARFYRDWPGLSRCALCPAPTLPSGRTWSFR
jgi:simple sugar transport system permease protein/ribose transport system permease protein